MLILPINVETLLSLIRGNLSLIDPANLIAFITTRQRNYGKVKCQVMRICHSVCSWGSPSPPYREPWLLPHLRHFQTSSWYSPNCQQGGWLAFNWNAFLLNCAKTATSKNTPLTDLFCWMSTHKILPGVNKSFYGRVPPPPFSQLT